MKTLKDIAEEFSSEHLLHDKTDEFGALREVAKEWVTHLDGNTNSCIKCCSSNCDHDEYWIFNEYESVEITKISLWIKHFFNLEDGK